MTRVSVLGAHTAVAKAFVECLEERDVEVELRLATTSEFLEGEMEIAGERTIADADLVVLTFAGKAALGLVDMARRLGRPVLDLAEATAGDPRAFWIFPGEKEGPGIERDRVAVVPLGLGAPIVSTLLALEPFSPARATIATYESVASAGQPAMDELSEQVRARFNMRDVEPKVFDTPIAFGCIPRVAQNGETAFASDARLRDAILAGVGRKITGIDLVVTRILVPTFSADGAVVVVDLGGPEDPGFGAVQKALAAARGIHDLGDALPSSFEAIGRDDAALGRLEVEGRRVRFWLASDRLRRGSATLGVLAVERWQAALDAA